MLHDIGALHGKENHAQRSFEYAKKLFGDENWIFKDFESVLDAINFAVVTVKLDIIIRKML